MFLIPTPALNFTSDDHSYVISPMIDYREAQLSKFKELGEEEFFRHPEVAIQTIIDAFNVFL